MKTNIKERVKRLSEELGLTAFYEEPRQLAHWDFLIEVGHDRIQVTQRWDFIFWSSFNVISLLIVWELATIRNEPNSKKRRSPVYVDFTKGPLAYRKLFGQDRHSPMSKAVGANRLSPLEKLSVLDATGGTRQQLSPRILYIFSFNCFVCFVCCFVLFCCLGLGKDAFVMAYLGCHVTICERNPVVYALLRDGIQRAQQVPDWQSLCPFFCCVCVNEKLIFLSFLFFFSRFFSFSRFSLFFLAF